MDADGTAHVFLQQVRESIPVFGAGIALHFRGNDFTGSNGRWVSSLSHWYRATPRHHAGPAVPGGLRARRGARRRRNPGSRELLGKPGLVFYAPELDHDGTWTAPASSPAGIVRPQRSSTPRLAAGARRARRTVGLHRRRDATAASSRPRRERDAAFNLEVFTARGHTSDLCFGSFLDDPTILWFTEEGLVVDEDDLDEDLDGLRAYLFIREAYDYWRHTLGRDSYDDDGAQIEMYVNYGHVANAYGSEDCLMFGDDWVTRDIVAHEFTHGMTDQTADLGSTREPGAINEHMSDVFGAMVDDDDWLVGEDLLDRREPWLRRPDGTGHGAQHGRPAELQ